MLLFVSIFAFAYAVRCFSLQRPSFSLHTPKHAHLHSPGKKKEKLFMNEQLGWTQKSCRDVGEAVFPAQDLTVYALVCGWFFFSVFLIH